MTNKKHMTCMKYFIAAVLSVLARNGCAQSSDFYIRSGGNVSTLTSDEYSLTPGYHIGFGGRKVFSDRLSMLHEFVFTQQGAKVKDLDVVQRIHYVQIPLLLRMQMKDQMYFTVGLQTGVVVSSDIRKEDLPLAATLHQIDVSISAGLGWQISEDWDVGFRVNPGLTDVIRSGESSPRNLVVQLTVIFNLNKRDE
jgi:hypothetical protein